MNEPRAKNSSPAPSGTGAAPLLHWVNVVIPAQFHNPSILNRDFLAKNIVPRNWDVVEAISTPAAAQIVYANGVRFVADQSRLEIRREINGEMRSTYDIFSIAERYVKALPHVPYKSLGLNWQLSLEHPHPDRWLLEHFYLPSVYSEDDPKVMGCGVQLRYAMQPAVCNMKLDAGAIQKPGMPQASAILVNANFHHEVNTLRKITAALKQWPAKQDFLRTLMAKLFREL